MLPDVRLGAASMSGVNLFGNEMLSRKKPTIAANLSRFLVVPPRPFQLRARHRPADSPRERQRACVRALVFN